MFENPQDMLDKINKLIKLARSDSQTKKAITARGCLSTLIQMGHCYEKIVRLENQLLKEDIGRIKL